MINDCGDLVRDYRSHFICLADCMTAMEHI